MSRNRIAAALVAMQLVAGCGVVLVNNPKRSGLDCSRSRVLPAIDLLLAGAGTAFLFQQGTATDEPATLAAPAVLVASALWGNVKVGRCRRAWESATPEQIAAFHRDQADRRAREEEARREEARRQQELAIAQTEAAARAAAAAPEAPRPEPESPQHVAAPEPAPAPTPAPAAPAAPAPPPNVTVTIESYQFKKACSPVSKTNECGKHATCQSIDDQDPTNHGFCMISCDHRRECPVVGSRKLQCTPTPLTNRQGRTVTWEVCM